MAEFRNDEEEEMATKLSKPNPISTVLGKTKNDQDHELIVKKQKLEQITDSVPPHSVNVKPVVEGVEGEDDEEDDVEYDLNGNDDDEDEDEDEDSNGKEVIDRKGKGKLVEESESSSDSDSGEAEYDSDSDLSDDPLAEVDLDNILPSRTRRHVPQRGIQIGNNAESDNHDA